jgi:hypothetical protein
MCAMLAWDALFVVALAMLSRLLASTLLLACGLPVLLTPNYLLVRRRPGLRRPPVGQDEPGARHNPFCLYVGSALFVGGALYGLALFCTGGLPWVLLPVLLAPLSLALYLLRAARRDGGRKAE